MNSGSCPIGIIVILYRYLEMDIEITIPVKGTIQVYIIFPDGTRVLANAANSHTTNVMNNFAANFITYVNRLPTEFQQLINVL